MFREKIEKVRFQQPQGNQHQQHMCAQTALKTATHKSNCLATVTALNDDYTQAHPLLSLTDGAEERRLSPASVINRHATCH